MNYCFKTWNKWQILKKWKIWCVREHGHWYLLNNLLNERTSLGKLLFSSRLLVDLVFLFSKSSKAYSDLHPLMIHRKVWARHRSEEAVCLGYLPTQQLPFVTFLLCDVPFEKSRMNWTPLPAFFPHSYLGSCVPVSNFHSWNLKSLRASHSVRF